MIEKQKKDRILRQIYKVLILMVLCCLFGGLIELLFQAKFFFLNASEKGVYELNLSEAETHGAELQEDFLLITGKNMEKHQVEESSFPLSNVKSRLPIGVDPRENNPENAVISFSFEKRYVDKLRLEFTTGDRFYATILLDTESVYGEPIQEKIPFSYTVQTGRGTLNIGKEVSGMTILVHAPGGNLVRAVALENRMAFNILRFGFFTAVGVVICMLLFYRKQLAKRAEIGFVVLSLTVGGLMIVTFPMDRTSWDEEIHYQHVANMSYFSSLDAQVPLTVSENDMIAVRRATINSMEDRKDVIHYLNVHSTPEYLETHMEKEAPYLKQVGYLTQMLFYKAAKVVGIPFYYAYLAGKVGNLLLYTVVMYFALRYMKKGRLLMAAVGLMPTPLLMACSYAYDPTVICFMMLGFAVIFRELLDAGQKISVKSFVIFSVSMVIASMPKAVYIPFILIALILPQSKFQSRRTMWIMKGIVVLLFLAMMSTFVLPALLGGSEMGDTRGGDTNVGEQLRLILGHPFAYAKILFVDSILGEFGSFVLGSQSMLHFAYLDSRASCGYLAMGILLFLAFTDHQTYETGGNAKKIEKIYVFYSFHKIMMGLLCLAVIVLIWTALYLDFTPVGSTTINGVQGRYYLPIMVPILLMLYTPKIKNHFSRSFYLSLVYGGMGCVLFVTVYEKLLLPYCM